MKEFPLLYFKGKGGALYQWRVWADGDQVFTEYGQVDGKLQQTPGKRCEGTNVGRVNERTPAQQAEFEAEAMWTFKLDRKYRLKPEEAEEQLFLPMLAHPIEKVKEIPYPVHVSAKLDGVRCLAYWEDGAVKLMSRSGKPYQVPHVQAALAQIMPSDAVFDGELYRPGLSCQTITSLVKRQQDRQRDIQYWVYDMPVVKGIDNLPWEERYRALFTALVHGRTVANGFSGLDWPIAVVECTVAHSLAAVREHELYHVQQGREGAIVRLLGGRYEWGYRSKHLLKVKTFVDNEFEVVGAREGDGRMAGCVIWKCRNDLTDATFECSMACSTDERRAYWQNRDQYVGRKLTVKFFDRTDDRLPRFPTGKLFRSNEDLPTTDQEII